MAEWSDLPVCVQRIILRLLPLAALASVAAVSRTLRTEATHIMDSRLQREKEAIIGAAGGASAENQTLFMFALKMMSVLRQNTHEGRISTVAYFLLDGTRGPTCLCEVPRSSLQTHVQQRNPRLVIGCRNLWKMVAQCVKFGEDDQHKYQAYCRSLMGIPLVYQCDNRIIYFVPFTLSEGAVTVRIKEECCSRVNAVSMGFLVCCRREAQKVQGLLLTLGEDELINEFPVLLRDLRESMLRKRIRPSVEICLLRPHLWQDEPHYNSGVSFTVVEAWICLSRVFNTLEMQPVGGGVPSRHRFSGTRKLFQQLRVYPGV